MAASLSNLVDNITEGIYKTKFKDCDCFLECKSVTGNLIKNKCLSCNKNYLNKIDKELKKRLKNTFKFSNNDMKKFILLLGKRVYSYEYMDKWEKCNETSLSKKEEFYRKVNMEDIKDAD